MIDTRNEQDLMGCLTKCESKLLRSSQLSFCICMAQERTQKRSVISISCSLESIRHQDMILPWPPGVSYHGLVFQLIPSPPLRQGDTALHWAARNGFKAVTEKLIFAGAKVDASGFQGTSDRLRGLPWSIQKLSGKHWRSLKHCLKHIRKSACFSDWMSWLMNFGQQTAAFCGKATSRALLCDLRFDAEGWH